MTFVRVIFLGWVAWWYAYTTWLDIWLVWLTRCGDDDGGGDITLGNLFFCLLAWLLCSIFKSFTTFIQKTMFSVFGTFYREQKTETCEFLLSWWSCSRVFSTWHGTFFCPLLESVSSWLLFAAYGFWFYLNVNSFFLRVQQPSRNLMGKILLFGIVKKSL